MKQKLAVALLAFAVSVNAASRSVSTRQDDKTPREAKQDKHPHPQQDKKDRKPEDKKDEKKKNEYDELLKKRGSVQKGLFTVRHIDDKWYFEVPDSMLGRYVLAVTRLTSVPQGAGKFSGEEVNENTLYFEKRDTATMLLRAYAVSQIAPEDSRIEQTLRASTTNPIVASFKIIGKNPNPHMSLIDVTGFFAKDNDVVSIPKDGGKQLGIGALQADRTFIDSMRVFPINIEIGSTRTYAATAGGSVGGRSLYRTPASATGSVTLGLNTSMVLLPKTPMRKRLWDERVGFFTTRVTYFDDNQHKTDREQIVARYRLEPKDAKAYARGKLTEPVRQIVYYIDPATPKKWVPYLIQGINDWNVAFEAAGFKNAIVAKEWPNDPDMSVDDARFCVLRYLPAEIENAYGPRIIDPRSGEIIESHICWYHNVMSLLTKWYMTQCGPLDKRARTMHFDDELMGQLIRFVSSHEVGHTLGLRHNMGASYATPVEKLRDKAWVEAHGHTVSIMDYARFNYVAQPEDNISPRGLFPRIGDYDKWAIKWGYQYRPEFKDEMDEKKGLMTETTKVLKQNPRLWFGGEGRGEDPRSQTEDLGDNSMKASDYGIRNLQRVIANLPKWTRQDNYQYEDLNEMYKSVRDQFRRYTGHVMRNVGGHYLNNLPGSKPVEVAPAAKEKEAIDWIGRNVFDAPMWMYPAELVEKTGLDVADDIASRQNNALSLLLAGGLMEKVYNDSYTQPAALQLDDYLNTVFANVWKPLDGSNSLQNRLHRGLERNYLDKLNLVLNPSRGGAEKASGSAAGSVSSDTELYLLQHLDKIEAYAKERQAASTGIDKLHYADIVQQVELIRARRVKVR